MPNAAKTNLTLAVEAIELLTIDEMRAFIPVFNAHLRQKQKMESMKKAATTIAKNEGVFVAGNILTWTSTKRESRGQAMFMKMIGFNRARTCAVGWSCDSKGVVSALPAKWTVGTGLLSLHTPK